MAKANGMVMRRSRGRESADGCHPEVLELRIEAPAVGRSERQALERVGAEEHDAHEECDDRRGDPGHIRHEVRVAARRQQLRQAREEREHHRPEEERSLLAGPERGDDEVGREVAAGVGGHVLDVEVVGDEPLPEGDRRHDEAAEDGVHRADDRRGQLGPIPPPAREGDRDRPEADEKRGPERELSQQRHGRTQAFGTAS